MAPSRNPEVAEGASDVEAPQLRPPQYRGAWIDTVLPLPISQVKQQVIIVTLLPLEIYETKSTENYLRCFTLPAIWS